jgi:hypothetical protein
MGPWPTVLVLGRRKWDCNLGFLSYVGLILLQEKNEMRYLSFFMENQSLEIESPSLHVCQLQWYVHQNCYLCSFTYPSWDSRGWMQDAADFLLPVQVVGNKRDSRGCWTRSYWLVLLRLPLSEKSKPRHRASQRSRNVFPLPCAVAFLADMAVTLHMAYRATSSGVTDLFNAWSPITGRACRLSACSALLLRSAIYAFHICISPHDDHSSPRYLMKL